MRWIFGFQRRRVARFEWETLFPKLGPLPHRSQIEDTLELPLIYSVIEGERLPCKRINWLIGY
jgi:hypothetical protein